MEPIGRGRKPHETGALPDQALSTRAKHITQFVKKVIDETYISSRKKPFHFEDLKGRSDLKVNIPH